MRLDNKNKSKQRSHEAYVHVTGSRTTGQLEGDCNYCALGQVSV